MRVAAEWEPHAACWTAWPTHASAWESALPDAQRQAAAFLGALVELPGSERLRILQTHLDGMTLDVAAPGLDAERIVDIPYGDIWLRDIGPLFVQPDGDGAPIQAVTFGFDGWGGKYVYPHDAQVGAAVARRSGATVVHEPFVLEGGALEFDGRGTVLTTRSCLLDPQRNAGATEASVEAMLTRRTGARRVLWLERGLLGDHTDGHIDNLARFIAPASVLCARPDASAGNADPNAEVLGEIEAQLRDARDADDVPLRVRTLPAVERLDDDDGAPLPASYLNFYIGNAAVLVPAFGRATDAQAADIIAQCFPGRRVRSLPANALLSGGGTFHCITRQQPAHLAHG